MPEIDHDKISQIIRDVAADKIVPRFLQLAEGDIKTKTSPTDLVTIADEEAEIELTRILKGVLPGSQVVGEEAVSSGAVTRDILKDTSATVWVVDPVDGTHNFAHGNPVFGTMVALIHKGERVGSWIYQIPRNRMVVGQKGSGIIIDGAPFQPAVKPENDDAFSTMHAYISHKFVPPAMRPFIQERYSLLKRASTCNCCAWEYVELLEGNAAFSIYSRIEPWDHMAGALLLEEAGFYTRKWDTSAYAATDLGGGVINAPSKELWERIYDTFLGEALKHFKKSNS